MDNHWLTKRKKREAEEDVMRKMVESMFPNGLATGRDGYIGDVDLTAEDSYDSDAGLITLGEYKADRGMAQKLPGDHDFIDLLTMRGSSSRYETYKRSRFTEDAMIVYRLTRP